MNQSIKTALFYYFGVNIKKIILSNILIVQIFFRSDQSHMIRLKNLSFNFMAYYL